MGQFEYCVLGLRVWKAAKLCIRKLSHSKRVGQHELSIHQLSSANPVDKTREVIVAICGRY